MYSPLVINKLAAKIEGAMPIKLREYSLAEVDEWVERMQLLQEQTGKQTWKLKRPLSEEEQMFKLNEQLMCKINFP